MKGGAWYENTVFIVWGLSGLEAADLMKWQAVAISRSSKWQHQLEQQLKIHPLKILIGMIQQMVSHPILLIEGLVLSLEVKWYMSLEWGGGATCYERRCMV